MINPDLEEIRLYCDCGTELVDGNFKLIDGVLMCLKCAENLCNRIPEIGVIERSPGFAEASHE